MKKTLSLILAAAMLLSVCGLASADAFFDAPPRSALKLAPMPASVPGVTVEHNEYTNMYTVTASEKPEWACANIWYDGYGHVDGITFDDNGVAVFKGGKTQIGIWWVGSWLGFDQYLTWVGTSDYPTEEDVEAFAEEQFPEYADIGYEFRPSMFWNVDVYGVDAEGNQTKIETLWWVSQDDYDGDVGVMADAMEETYAESHPEYASFALEVLEDFQGGWNISGLKTVFGYSGNDALLLGYPGMQVWYTRGGKPVRITVSMSEDPFGTDKEFESASVGYKWSDEYGYKWYVSAVDATYKNGPVKSVHVEYPDTMAGNWLRYTVTLSSGGELTYTR